MGRDREEHEGIPTTQALEVLRLSGVDVGVVGTMTYLDKGEIHIALELPDSLNRRAIHALHRTFDIPIHYFYRPEMIPRK